MNGVIMWRLQLLQASARAPQEAPKLCGDAGVGQKRYGSAFGISRKCCDFYCILGLGIPSGAYEDVESMCISFVESVQNINQVNFKILDMDNT